MQDTKINRDSITYLPAYEAPVGEKEVALAAIWLREFNLDRIGRQDDFFDLGGDSHKAFELALHIEDVFGVPVESSSIIERSTIARQAEILDDQPDENLPAWLIGTNMSGSKPPVFFVHGALGVTYLDRKFLGYMGKDLPVYFFRLPGLKEGESFLRSVEEIASTYISALRMVQSKGPYRIIANCSCCLIGSEMALQLEDDGDTVETLVLVDPSVKIMDKVLGKVSPKLKEPGVAKLVSKYFVEKIDSFRHEKPELADVDDVWVAEIERFARKYRRRHKDVLKVNALVSAGSTIGIEDDIVTKDADVIRALIMLNDGMTKYRPARPRSEGIQLIVSQRWTSKDLLRLPNSIDTQAIPGGHFEMFDELLETTAKAMRSSL